jgi:peptide/nickel transport system permease protein
VPLLVVVSGLSFVLVSLTPGNAAREILGVEGTPQAYASLRRALGLNLPLYEQYWRWLERAVQGNLGTSLISGQPVGQAIAQRLPVTVELIVGTLLVSVLVGVAFGAFSAVRGGVAGRLVDAVGLVGFALPAYWVGAELIVLFAVKLHWFPAVGFVSPGTSVTGWLKSLALPVAALSVGVIAAIAKQTREAMLEVLASQHIQIAWASGWAPASIYFRHALKNAMPRVITVIAVQAVWLVGGTVLIENIFALPGLGSLVVNAAEQHDLPVVQSVAVVFTLIVVAVNMAVDLTYTWLDPRVHLR